MSTVRNDAFDPSGVSVTRKKYNGQRVGRVEIPGRISVHRRLRLTAIVRTSSVSGYRRGGLDGWSQLEYRTGSEKQYVKGQWGQTYAAGHVKRSIGVSTDIVTARGIAFLGRK